MLNFIELKGLYSYRLWGFVSSSTLNIRMDDKHNISHTNVWYNNSKLRKVAKFTPRGYKRC